MNEICIAPVCRLATGKSMENDKIRPLADLRPSTDRQNLKQVITSVKRPPVQNFVQIRPLGASRQRGEI